ncbi:MAG: o-succinylbenzoate synthase [Caldilineaceae bacterium]
MYHASYYPYVLELRRPAGTSRGPLHTKNTCFIRLARTDAPAVAGWGECGPVAGLSIDDRPDFLAQVDRICTAINRGVEMAALDLTPFPALAFALECAQLDLRRGGKQQLFDTPFTRGECGLPTHGLIWMDAHDGILRQIERKAQQGFRCIKMKVGALPFEAEVALLRAIRQQFPAREFALRLDANGAFSPAAALERLHELAPFDIHFLEQPIKPARMQPNGVEAMAALCAQSPIALGLDEELIGMQVEQIDALLDGVRPQHLVLKPTQLGGLAAAEAWMAAAEARGIQWWINSALESNVGLNALANG